jgi:murein DD-endopeptidase MepM/ murein hydrolase activator NlpD
MVEQHLSGRRRGRAGVLALALTVALGGCVLPRWPIDSTLTSPFGLRWDGVLPSVHTGVDLRADEGTPVRAMASGRVRFSGWMNGYGNVVWIDHPGGIISLYAHLLRIDVSEGTAVGTQEVIGVSGSTGTTTGPHLHFEIWKRGRQVDPVQYLGGGP